MFSWGLWVWLENISEQMKTEEHRQKVMEKFNNITRFGYHSWFGVLNDWKTLNFCNFPTKGHQKESHDQWSKVKDQNQSHTDPSTELNVWWSVQQLGRSFPREAGQCGAWWLSNTTGVGQPLQASSCMWHGRGEQTSNAQSLVLQLL